jgi:predicted heme/steroid binding protein
LLRWRRAAAAERAAAEADARAAAALREARRALAARDRFTHADLERFDGRGGGPVLLCVAGEVFDVTDGRGYYERGGVYEELAGGRDAARLLAKGILTAESAEEAAQPLTPAQLATLHEWQEHFHMKYLHLGRLEEAGGAAAELESALEELHGTLDPAALTPAQPTTMAQTMAQPEWREIYDDMYRSLNQPFALPFALPLPQAEAGAPREPKAVVASTVTGAARTDAGSAENDHLTAWRPVE